MRKFIAGAVLVLISTFLSVIGGSPAYAGTTCESAIARHTHLFVESTVDQEGTGNFAWSYCNVSPGVDYIVIKTLGGNFDMNDSTTKCSATSSFGGMVGLRVQLILPDETVTVMVPCDEDGVNGYTKDIANRYFYATTPCGYAPNDGCRAGVNYKMKLTIVWEGTNDSDWTSTTKFLGP